ncbi:MAG: choice-of-anchor E domain-containing protein [Planctomycetes bacterium]|nr:choice-of-anchor E domain-containing protein [Planctomycetota bacterium]
MRTLLCSSLLIAFVLAPLARAGELTHTATVPLATSPWSQNVSIPRFSPSLGTLDDVRVELRNVVRGRVGYENTAASPATSVISLQGTLTLTGGGNNVSTIAALPVAAQTQAFDGVIDFAGPSGGLVANLVAQATNQSTPTESLYVGSGSVTLTLDATNTSNVASGAPLQLNPRVQVDAEVRVTYVYTPPADCDNDGTPDSAEPDSDGDGYPDDCDRSSANYHRPGSLLVFPEFDDLAGSLTMLTVTNTKSTGSSVNVVYTYVSGSTCFVANRTRTLLPGDTFSGLSALDNPSGQQRGYAYVFAVGLGGTPIPHDHLVGSSLRLNGFNGYAYGIDAFAFRAGPGLTNTDVDLDGLRDLNGIEYDRAPDELIFPRFIGSANGRESDLILLNLTGGTGFTAVVNFLIWNDNTGLFSAQHSFSCWDKRPLSSISGAFTDAFLQSTNHDVNEPVGFPGDEMGWFRIDGQTSTSSAVILNDPALLAVLVERTTTPQYAVELPFEIGEQANGDLLITSLNGDTVGN